MTKETTVKAAAAAPAPAPAAVEVEPTIIGYTITEGKIVLRGKEGEADTYVRQGETITTLTPEEVKFFGAKLAPIYGA